MENLGVTVNFLSGPHSSRHKCCPYVNCCGDESFEVYIKLCSLSLQASLDPEGKVSYKTT